MIALDGEVLRVSGAMTLAQARALHTASSPLLAQARIVDLAAVTEVDSSALAVLFSWLRAVPAGLTLRHVPADLLALAEVYGVRELLPCNTNCV